MDVTNKHYLVTGGCGFIGSHLVDHLLQSGHQVTVLDNLSTGKRENLSPQAKLVVGDVADQALLYELLSKVDGCFHLAAMLGITLSEDKWLASNQTNLVSTITLFDTLRQLKPQKTIPVVYASSCAVYGDCPHLPLSEKDYPAPISAYGADKLACELQARVASYVHQIPTVGVRIFNAYGPRQDPSSPYSGVISRFIKSIKKNNTVHIFGDGSQTRDFVFVLDIVTAFAFFMEKIEIANGVYNVCTGKAITINQLADTLSEKLKMPVTKQYGPIRTGDTLHSCGNPEKAARIGLIASYTLQQGLRDYIATLPKES